MESPLRSGVPDGTRLIETFGWRPDDGFRHLDRHLSRMARSAKALGFAFDQKAAEAALVVGGEGAMRCRLTLGADGFDFTSTPMAEITKPWIVRIAKTRLQTSNLWLRHKTTQRALYDQDRAALPAGTDEWLYANEEGLMCEGTITNLFVTRQDGQMITPPADHGLLPGILREVMLGSGQVIEAPVTREDLKAAKEIHLGNSLRGLIKSTIEFD